MKSNYLKNYIYYQIIILSRWPFVKLIVEKNTPKTLLQTVFCWTTTLRFSKLCAVHSKPSAFSNSIVNKQNISERKSGYVSEKQCVCETVCVLLADVQISTVGRFFCFFLTTVSFKCSDSGSLLHHKHRSILLYHNWQSAIIL